MISPQIVINVLGFVRGRGKSRAETEATTTVTVCLMIRRGNNTHFRTEGSQRSFNPLFVQSARVITNLSKGREEVEKQGRKLERSRKLTALTEI